MPSDEDEITLPGTPDALRTMHELQKAVALANVRLSAICEALDRIEKVLPVAVRDGQAAKSEAQRAFASAREAAQKARFSDKRIDSLVARVQGLENGSR